MFFFIYVDVVSDHASDILYSSHHHPHWHLQLTLVNMNSVNAQAPSRLKVASVVAFYMAAALVMVFVNKVR